MLNVGCRVLNYMNFLFSFKIQNLAPKIRLFAIAFIVGSCHSGSVNSNQDIRSGGSVFKQYADTITPKITTIPIVL
jgi:hypothetical protein